MKKQSCRNLFNFFINKSFSDAIDLEIIIVKWPKLTIDELFRLWTFERITIIYSHKKQIVESIDLSLKKTILEGGGENCLDFNIIRIQLIWETWSHIKNSLIFIQRLKMIPFFSFLKNKKLKIRVNILHDCIAALYVMLQRVGIFNEFLFFARDYLEISNW